MTLAITAMVNDNQAVIIQGSDEFSDQFITAIGALRYLMIYMGIWPKRKHEKLYKLLWYLHLATLSFLICGLLCGLADVSHDMDKTISNLSITSTVTCIISKWLTFSWRRVLIKKLVHFMDKDWINLENNTMIYKNVRDSRRIMTKYYQALNIFILTILFMAVVAIGNFMTDSVAVVNHRGNDTDQSRTLIVPYSWYHHNRDRGYTNQFLVFAQISSMLSTFLATTAIDGFLVATILHLSSQLKILRLFVEGIVYEPCHPQNYKKKVREMVKRHQVLLSVAATLQEYYSLIALQHVMACVLALCFLECSFLMELQENEASRTSLLTFGLFAIGSLETAFIYCFAGDSLTNEGFAIGLAIYRCEWYSFTRSANLSLSIAMIRAQKPIEISAAQIFPLTLENFTVIVKAAASYLSTLRAYSMVEA